MGIKHIHSFLVYPSKGDEESSAISGAEVPFSGQLYTMLSDLYNRADEECDVEIVFRPTVDGRQTNECRSLLVEYASNTSIDAGRSIADRLQQVTTRRSGIGLLFLISGREESRVKLVLARFPANQGVIAREGGRGLTVEFIERVFMKSSKAYKCAVYRAESVQRELWKGRAVDKQINGDRELSQYWISEFLCSDLTCTPAAGTKRLAVAWRDAIKETEDADVKSELISASHLLKGQDGRTVSPSQLVSNFGLSDEARKVVESSFPRPELFNQTFQFDSDEFGRHIMYRSVELSNGAVLVGENAAFDDIFSKQLVADQQVMYSTTGHVVKQYLRSVKR